jgi:PAS domain S-box-containing protein
VGNDTHAACGEGLRTSQRVIVEDVRTSPIFIGSPSLKVLLSDGVLGVQVTPLLSTSGKVLGMLATHFKQPHRPNERDLRLLDLLAKQTADYLERRRADEAIRTREAQLQILFETSPLGIYLVDADFRIRQVNATAAPVFSQIPDLIGRDFDEVLHRLWSREYADEIVRIFRRTLETGEPYVTSERVEERRDRGMKEYYEWRIDRIPLPDGRYGVVCHFRDISAEVLAQLENERLYEREQRAREAAEQATLAKDEFLAIVSHELRSPLNAILGYNRVLRAKSDADPDIIKAAEIIERNGRAQVQLIEDLLDTSRIISGKLKLELSSVELTDIVGTAVDTVRPAAESKNIKLNVETRPDRCSIIGDAPRLQQIVWNLLSNAIKFTPQRGRVDVVVEKNESFVHISVEDTGTGIPAELLPYVFDRFKQGDSSASRRFGGLGLGLSLVKQLTELHGGIVTAKSDGEGRGSRFTVILPVRTTAADSSIVHGFPRAVPGLDGIRVLIVDDDETTRRQPR